VFTSLLRWLSCSEKKKKNSNSIQKAEVKEIWLPAGSVVDPNSMNLDPVPNSGFW
jgi:hypothetical protein